MIDHCYSILACFGEQGSQQVYRTCELIIELALLQLRVGQGVYSYPLLLLMLNESRDGSRVAVNNLLKTVQTAGLACSTVDSIIPAPSLSESEKDSLSLLQRLCARKSMSNFPVHV